MNDAVNLVVTVGFFAVVAIIVFQFFGPLDWWWAGPGTRHRA